MYIAHAFLHLRNIIKSSRDQATGLCFHDLWWFGLYISRFK